MRFQRHTRVWATAAGHAALRARVCDATARFALDLWSSRGWPFVVRRSEVDETHFRDPVAVGLALPPSMGKQRVQLRLKRDEIAMQAPPLALDEVVALAAPKLRRTLEPLARAAARERIPLCVFGSVAWQVQTGLDYLHVYSDLDSLVEPPTGPALDSAIALLERMQPVVEMRIDGEIVFPGGDAVAWREWTKADGENRVLAKSVTGVALLSRSVLQNRFEESKLAV